MRATSSLGGRRVRRLRTCYSLDWRGLAWAPMFTQGATAESWSSGKTEAMPGFGPRRYTARVGFGPAWRGSALMSAPRRFAPTSKTVIDPIHTSRVRNTRPCGRGAHQQCGRTFTPWRPTGWATPSSSATWPLDVRELAFSCRPGHRHRRAGSRRVVGPLGAPGLSR